MLPSLRTLRRVVLKFLHLESRYLTLRAQNLNCYERTVILLFDETVTHFRLSFGLHGTLQNDHSELRFGRYRQMSGGIFFISVQQIIESEKIRLVSLLKHSGVTLAKIITNDNLKESIEGLPLSSVLNLIAPSILKCQKQSHR